MLNSVIVCTHNPREDYFRRVLKALEEQTLPKDQWELLLIDNASNELLSERCNLSWHPKACHIREEELGLTPARLRGIREARGDVLIFVDDDCELHPEYLENATKIHRRHPLLGTWGGQCLPEFEEKPPEWVRAYSGFLTIRTFEHEQWCNLYDREAEMPWGAGICIRKDVAANYLKITEKNPAMLGLDRSGGKVFSCGDLAIVFSGRALGYGFGIFPELKLNHLIPKSRATEDYLLRVVEGHACSWILLKARYGESICEMKIGPVRRILGIVKRKLTMPARQFRFFEARLRGIQAGLSLKEKFRL
jgi:glycosyltransferase involved in cell wall biosynthesis